MNIYYFLLLSYIICEFISTELLKRTNYIVRVCNGPSCSNMGSDYLYDKLIKVSSTELETSKSLNIAYGQCSNACKRSCSVSVIRKTESSGTFIKGMDAYERNKGCFVKVNDDSSIDRVFNLIQNFMDEAEE